MGGPEGVVDEEVAQLGKLPGELRVVGLFARVKTQILQQCDPARLQPSHDLLRRWGGEPPACRS